MRQRFEPVRDKDDLAVAYDLLRYEAATQKKRIATLEERIARLEADLAGRERALELAQGLIDRLNARLLQSPERP